ncbi:alanine aminotransferase 1-like isoform X1 [Varroa jacobsoni]|uniref:alanine transaminase n=2 Tax=Varroa TaxID=62624 RepID=A0A7M7KV56_VARDE|nr:alanine aminotransferase 1-like [Varroa destructor]XP_022693774.1 alanine aminotransferase 1-like isoform X1 [Varroa jacobsoni]
MLSRAMTSLADAAGSGLSGRSSQRSAAAAAAAQLTAKATATAKATGAVIGTTTRIVVAVNSNRGTAITGITTCTADSVPTAVRTSSLAASSTSIQAATQSALQLQKTVPLFSFSKLGTAQRSSQKVWQQQLFQQLHTTSTKMEGNVIRFEDTNKNLRVMEYAVRGPIVIRAGEIERQLKDKPGSLPFKQVIRSNIGDCHATGQKAITFIRQVLATCVLPDQFLSSDTFPSDVRKRARLILESCGGQSVGAYSDSAGVPIIKQHVAEFISNRDGVDTRPENIVLQGGASEAIRSVLSLLNEPINGQQPGVMIPIPQYPLYTATLAEYDMGQIPYYLDEDNNWALNISELERSIKDAKRKCIYPRAIVIINPGNPTGSVLSEANIKEIIKFAHKYKLVLLADEVYQHNVWIGKFYSFRKVHYEMGAPFNKSELVSFMSCSKGFMGECGLRGGYMELVNFDPEVKKVLLKSISAKLCSTVLGQAAMDCVVKPPVQGDPSYELFVKEKEAVLEQLRIKAKMVASTFNTFEGFKCNPVAGAMYAFPRLSLPQRAIKKAESLNQQPDFFYVKQLLEETGICVVPGSGFGQKPGTFHFRTTILPPTDQLKEMLYLFRNFHQKFMKEYK